MKLPSFGKSASPTGYEEGSFEQEYMSYRGRKILIIVVSAILLIIATGVSLLTVRTINPALSNLGFFDVYAYVINHILGVTYPRGSFEYKVDYVLWLYTPRVYMAIVVGACLAICGVAMQSVMNNPLADPYTVGISDGACFGAVAAIVMGFSVSTLSASAGVVVSAFICGLIPAFIIIFLSSVVRMSPATAILVGIALSYIFSGLEATIMVTTDADTLKTAYLWQIGSLDKIKNWDSCVIPTIAALLSGIFLTLSSSKLNLLSLGDDSAVSLGLDVNRFRTLVMIIVSIAVAAMVSFVGIIGFVGLVAPHLIRMIIGGDNKFLIPSSMMIGAIFIMVADTISRTIIAPDELRVGLIASIIGAPIFLYIILKRKRNYGEAL